MANANPAQSVKERKRRLKNGLPDPTPLPVALPTISTHIVADKTANLVSEHTHVDGVTVVRHYS